MNASRRWAPASGASTLPEMSVCAPLAPREAVRIAAAALSVSAALAAGLRAADALPSLLTGEPRGVTRFASAEEASRRLGVALLVPGYVPPQLARPPAAVRAVAGSRATVEIRLDGLDGRRGRLRLFQAIPPATELSRALVEPGETFHEASADVHGLGASLRTVRLSEERELLELSVPGTPRPVLLRFSGPGDELLRIAESLEPVKP